jgi:Spy/CpxP family protein refolding chaperone
MKLSKVTVLAAISLVLLVTSVLYAGPGGLGGGPGGMGNGGAFWGNLSKEQKAQMNSLRLDFLKKQEPLREQMAKKRIELMEMTSKDKSDEGAIQKKKEEIWALQDQMRNERRAMSTNIRAMLTPEQRAEFGAMGPGAGCPMGMRGGMGGGRGYGRCCGGMRGGAASL